MDKPKPCPFCGIELALNTDAEDAHLKLLWEHPHNGCVLEDFAPCDLDDLTAWNRRAPVRVSREEIERAILNCYESVRTEAACSILRELGIEVSDDEKERDDESSHLQT